MLGPILYLILFLLAMALLWKLLKSVFKLVIFGLLIILISVAVFTFFLVKDINDIKNNEPGEEKLFLIDDNGTVIYAANISGLYSMVQRETPFIMLDKEKTDAINSVYSKNDLKEVKGDYNKVFIIQMKTIEDALPDQIEMPKKNLEAVNSAVSNSSKESSTEKMPSNISKTDLLALIRSDNPNLIIADIMTRHLSNPKQIELVKAEVLSSPDMTNENIKGMALGLAVNELMKKGLGNLLFEFKNDGISIYPKPFLISVLKSTPNFLIDMFISVPDVTGESEAAGE